MNKYTIKSALQYGQQILKEAGINTYHLDTRILLEYAAGLSHEEIVLNQDKLLSEEQYTSFTQVIDRRFKRVPIAQIINKKEFFGIEFKVTKDTLAPRPDSETLIETILKLFPNNQAPLRVLDLGTGTGCLLLTVLSLYPNASGVGVDISEAALTIAKENSFKIGLEKRAEFILNYWGNDIDEKFDLIISNPPYIRDAEIAELELEVRSYEPHLALAGGDDGLSCYKEIAPFIFTLLKKDGFAVIECGKQQEQDIAAILLKHNVKTIFNNPDLAGVIRCLVAKLY